MLHVLSLQDNLTSLVSKVKKNDEIEKNMHVSQSEEIVSLLFSLLLPMASCTLK